MHTRLLYLFTRTPLHVGAGSSVGAIDQPIVRERHTGFPIIPGSAIKGVLADLWSTELITDPATGKSSRDLAKDIAWLFGSDDAREDKASAGALSVGEAKLLAFPIRSAKGSFAWITSPQLVARATRDGVVGFAELSVELCAKLADSTAALFEKPGPLALPSDQVVLEDYVFNHAGVAPPPLLEVFKKLPAATHFSSNIAGRLVILSDGMMSHFARTACEIAQHVRINDATGTADEGGLFNQENVPADALFFAVVHATPGRNAAHRGKPSAEALAALATRLATNDVSHSLQIGADSTTGLGYCTATLA